MPVPDETTGKPGGGAPAPAGGRQKLSRSEAARHASLVRWGKEQPFAARLEAVRERRKAAKKAKAAKGKGKAKKTPEQIAAEKEQKKKEALAAQRAEQARILSEQGIDENTQAALTDARAGDMLSPANGKKLEAMGLAEQAKDGSYRLTAAGRRVADASERGDAGLVSDTLSQARDKATPDEKKPAAGGGGGGGGEKKETPEEKKEAQAKERAATADKTAASVGLKPDALEVLRAAAEGRQASIADSAYPAASNALVALGLVTEGDETEVTDQGRRALVALERGDVRQYRAALQDAKARLGREKDKTTREGERAKQKEERDALRDEERSIRDEQRAAREKDKAARDEEREAKRTARQERIQGLALMRLSKGGKVSDAQLADLEEAGLVDLSGDKPALTEAGRKKLNKKPPMALQPATKGIDMNEIDTLIDLLEQLVEADADLPSIKAGARHSAKDNALVQAIHDAAEDICELACELGAEPGEGEEEEYTEDNSSALEGKAQETFGGKDRGDLDDDSFAGPNRTFPIVTAADVADAASLLGKAENPEAVKRKIIAIAKRKGFPLPKAWEETKKALDEEDAPSLDFLIGDAVKALEDGRIGAYAVRFGSEAEPDMSHMRDYFTKSTDFWLDAWDRRPMLYHHAMDEDTADSPRIGTWTKAEVKDEGVWLEGQLDRGHRYYSAIKELVRRGVLRLSSDSAPHLVRREIKGGSQTHEVTRWPLLAASLTPTPAEPRLSAVSFKALLAELGLEGIESTQEADDAAERDRQDAAKALEDRTRRALMELDLLALENTVL